MKRFVLAITLLAVVLMTAGCKKDKVYTNGIPATITHYNGGKDAKVYVDAANYSVWHNGDAVKINGYDETVTDPNSDNHYIASITNEQTGTHYAIFPASAASSSYSVSSTPVTLPAEQTYSVDGNGNQVVDALMAAKGTKSLKFYNLCALLRVEVPANTYVNYIAVSTVEGDAPMCGSGSVSFSGDVPVLTMSSNNPTVVKLNVEASRADGKFYVAVPATSGKKFKVSVYYRSTEDDINHYLAKTVWQSTALGIAANEIGPVNMGTFENRREYVPGQYSVSSTKKVMFSRGNLQYMGGTYTDESSWKFNQNQYDVGQYNSAGNSNYFSQYTNAVSNPAVLANNVSGTTIDWGTLFDHSDNIHWFTLTEDEWLYLLNSRVGAGIVDHSYTRGNVAGVNGMILFPDGFDFSNFPTAAGSAPTSYDAEATDYETCTYTAEQWSWLEKEGCVFLPAGGWVNHNEGAGTAQHENNADGWYRTMTPAVIGDNHSQALHFTEGTVSTVREHTGKGYYVRLVYAIEAIAK
ncbi:MAG: hypothetical protein IJM74_08075 [Bacteroidales bacterium]|nr:hypothetical protein [Bacteroidales bacterium]